MAAPRDEFGFERLQPIMARGTRIAKSVEIATLISWLASDGASNVNGAIVPADGGWPPASSPGVPCLAGPDAKS